MKIQVIFYSMYGHVYQHGRGGGRRRARACAGAEVSLFQVRGAGAGRGAEKSGAKAARDGVRARPLADAGRSSPRPTPSSSARRRASATCARRCATSSTRPAGCGLKGALDRQGRQRLRQHRHPARRPGDDDHQLPHHAAAPRHDHRRRALLRAGPGQHERDHRRHALRRVHAGRRDGSRQPSENELAIARFQGKHVAEITRKIAGG